MVSLLALLSLHPARAEEEDEVTATQSIDAYDEMEDGQAGPPGVVEERLWLGSGFEGGLSPSETFELSYTPKSRSRFLSHTELDVAQVFEREDLDSTSGIELGVVNRWVKDGGKKSPIPTIGTLTEYWLRTPFVSRGEAFARSATQGDAIAETLTVAKYLGPGTIYLNGEVERRLGQTQVCSAAGGEPLQPGEAPDRNGVAAPNYSACDYWAPWNFALRLGYKAAVVPERFDLVLDVAHETSPFLDPAAAGTGPAAEPHVAEDLVEVSTMLHLGEHFTVGPGATLALAPGSGEAPGLSAGLFFLHE